MTPTLELVYVSAYLGAGGDWLHMVDPSLTPPVSWMGGKRRLAGDILALLGLRPGRPIPALLGDASWWGWVWPVVLDTVTGPLVSEVLRSWRGEDPRALWFRLRDVGPFTDLVQAAAQLLWLQARAASGVPVWWEGHQVVSMDGHGRGPYAAWQATCQPKDVRLTCDRHPPGMSGDKAMALRAAARGDRPAESYAASQRTTSGGRLLQHVTATRLDDAGQRQAPETRLKASNGHGQTVNAGHKADSVPTSGGMQDPGTIADRLDAVRRLVQWAGDGRTRQNEGKGFNKEGAGGIVDPGTIADRLEAIRAHRAPVTILHTDALTLSCEYAAQLGPRARVYLDPPYQGCTGYPVASPRDEVLTIADLWAAAGAKVVLSEAVPLADDLGTGWASVQIGRGKKPEWVTCYGCDTRAHLPPLLRRISA